MCKWIKIFSWIYILQHLLFYNLSTNHFVDLHISDNEGQRVFGQFIESLRVFPHWWEGSIARGSLRLSAPFFALSMLLIRSTGTAWIVIIAPNRIQEHPNDGTWEPGRVELNGCQTLKAPQHVNKLTKAGRVHF